MECLTWQMISMKSLNVLLWMGQRCILHNFMTVTLCIYYQRHFKKIAIEWFFRVSDIEIALVYWNACIRVCLSELPLRVKFSAEKKKKKAQWLLYVSKNDLTLFAKSHLGIHTCLGIDKLDHFEVCHWCAVTCWGNGFTEFALYTKWHP